MITEHPQLPDFNLTQAITQMVTGAVNDRRQREADVGFDELTEWHQQIQVAVSGTAGNVAVYAPVVQLQFDVLFAQDLTHRDAVLVKPHFTYGFELVAGFPVAVAAQVSAWAQDNNGTYAGCSLLWSAQAPDQLSAVVPFSGFLHCNFQGYGAPPDIDESQLADDLGAG